MDKILFFVCLLLSQIFGYSNYPGTCNPNNMPQGGHNVASTPDGNGKMAFTVNGVAATLYTPGQPLSLTYTTNVAIGGFVLYAKDGNGNFVGAWNPANGQALISSFGVSGQTGGANDCNQGSFALGQSAFLNAAKVTATFNAPAAGTGPITFTAITCPQRQGCFLNTLAVQPGAVPTGTTKVASTTAPVGNPAGTSTPPASGAPIGQQPAQQQAAGAGGIALSTGALAGIIVGSVLGVLLIALIVVPVIYARVRQDDPLVKRFTNRLTGGFRRGGAQV
jgi:hypothetical protein